MASFPTPSTPFPSHLLDDVMPTLKDTEWRILCVIVRQTLGWQAGEGRKRSDWLTHRQLMRRTGRASEAVSKAIDGLIRRGLIEVQNSDGDVLLSPASRRAQGRLYFRLHPGAFGRSASQLPVDNPGDKFQKSEVEDPISEIRKAKITKENEYKNTPYGGETGRACSPDIGENLQTGNQTSTFPSSEVTQFLKTYQRFFRCCSPRGDPPPIAWGKDGKRIKQLLQTYSYERLVELLEQFFQSNDRWIRQRGYSLSTFYTVLPQLLMNALSSLPSDPLTRTGSWMRAGTLGSTKRGTASLSSSPKMSAVECMPSLDRIGRRHSRFHA
jgi:hypothetical protein